MFKEFHVADVGGRRPPQNLGWWATPEMGARLQAIHLNALHFPTSQRAQVADELLQGQHVTLAHLWALQGHPEKQRAFLGAALLFSELWVWSRYTPPNRPTYPQVKARYNEYLATAGYQHGPWVYQHTRVIPDIYGPRSEVTEGLHSGQDLRDLSRFNQAVEEEIDLQLLHNTPVVVFYDALPSVVDGDGASATSHTLRTQLATLQSEFQNVQGACNGWMARAIAAEAELARIARPINEASR